MLHVVRPSFIFPQRDNMSYTQYHTDALIVGEIHHGESSKVLILFSPTLGLVYAHARALRKITSKLRFSAKRFSLVHVSLVRGKGVWRLVYIEERCPFGEIQASYKKRWIAAQLYFLIRKFIRGEGEHEDLFRDVVQAFTFLNEKMLEEDMLQHFEIVLIARLMHNLGYLPHTKTLSPLLQNETWDVELVERAGSCKKEALFAIHDSFVASGL